MKIVYFNRIPSLSTDDINLLIDDLIELHEDTPDDVVLSIHKRFMQCFSNFTSKHSYAIVDNKLNIVPNGANYSAMCYHIHPHIEHYYPKRRTDWWMGAIKKLLIRWVKVIKLGENQKNIRIGKFKNEVDLFFYIQTTALPLFFYPEVGEDEVVYFIGNKNPKKFYDDLDKEIFKRKIAIV